MKAALRILTLWLTLLLAFAALPVRAETIDVYDNHGGSVVAYDQRWSAIGQQGTHVRVVGPCKSACTVLLGHIPRDRICVTPQASFGFHLAKMPRATVIIWNLYPADIKDWINAHGGLQTDLVWIRAPDTYQHFKKC